MDDLDNKKVIIEFQNISKSFDDNKIIDDFNLKIFEKEFLTIIGSSGCGKTTILKMINGLVKPSSGKIFVDGKDISKEDMVNLRRKIGYSIQGTSLFPHLSVKENISYVLKLINKKNKNKIENDVEKWMKITNLDHDLIDRYPEELSGGQQQRVGIARALAASPKILLMDESFGAVDAITRKQLQKEIKKIHEKTQITIVFVTHDINEALALGDRTLIMNNGTIEQLDIPKNVMDCPSSDFVKQLTEPIY
ncbi:glycine/betaine ABC transporter ATP-binding protein [Methanobrevibacter arboriphilus]|jgi:osmoprotectant transport system ATP-binding protein|uniref:Glycine/betaine ABC transporter ATP-binding protein n=1 Tax=Methanobrevibacter arboriphilus TaxID=39441 RepID=A0ACA8R281_METAZ|nr:ABC transporter ATP-binding protein [Methanobrevibacter arboriphilus]BBL61760.1 glycine/betaine ABC transporter ATP-binding protein [Methanobrevibacter arboriphilus]GLI12773.1 glycine/betaine ABC transporter ATP-binding protein [Methanobrevibacter arboriphilus]